jgi:WD repeat-containing protein 7
MNPVSASKPLLIPLMFPAISEINNGKATISKTSDLVEVSCSAAGPSVLLSWGLSSTLQFKLDDGDTDDPLLQKGVAMGCQDGSVYLFAAPNQPASSTSTPVDVPNIEVPESPPLSPFRLSRHSRPASLSRSRSPSVFHQSPFYVTPRARVVSGLSTEQAEAPKNFVDFDDEAERLKDILKGKAPRDKKDQDALPDKPVPSLTLLPVPTTLDAGGLGLKRKSAARSLLSATNSPAFTPTSLSAPTSPRLPSAIQIDTIPSGQLSLRCHIIPPRSGSGNPITGMRLINDNRFLVTLQVQG